MSMGADGGVIWIPLCDPKEYSQVYSLLKPFRGLIGDSGMSDVAEDGFSLWREKNTKIIPPNFLLGHYGTDWWDIDLNDLRNNLICPESLQGFTWLEIIELEFHKINPKEVWYAEMDCLFVIKLLYSHFQYSSSLEVIEEFGPVALISIQKWFDKLNQLLEWKNIQMEETWT